MDRNKLLLHGKEYEVELSSDGKVVYVNSERFLIQHIELKDSGRMFLIVNGITYEAIVEFDGSVYSVYLNGKFYNLTLIDNRALDRALDTVRSGRSPTPITETTDIGERTVVASMPGMVMDIKVGVGTQVQKGDSLLILEAMKMENEVRTPVSGTVAQIFVKVGDSINSQNKLIRIKSSI